MMAATATHVNAADKKKNPEKSVEMLKKDLPPDWEIVPNTDPNVKKEYYYWNRRTNQTSWKFPHAEAEAHKFKLDEHLYQNVKIRSRVKSDETPPSPRSPKPGKKQNSVPPLTPPPPLGPKPGADNLSTRPKLGQENDAKYSVVSQNWIDKKRYGAQKPNATTTAAATTTTTKATNSSISETEEEEETPPLPPRSELADQFDEDLYDLPMIRNDEKKIASVKITSSAAGNSTASNTKSTIEKQPAGTHPVITTVSESSEVAYDVIADVKSPVEKKVEFSSDLSGKKSPVDRNVRGTSPMVNRKMATLPKPSSEAMYDVISDVNTSTSKSLTMPAATRRSPSPEYAVVRNNPVLPVKGTVKPGSPVSKKPLPSAGEYACVSVKNKTEESTTAMSEYDLPVSARDKELSVNSPPSPMLSNYAKLKPKDSTRNDKQEWQIPKQSNDAKKKTSRTVSADVVESSKHATATDSINKTIKELEMGLDEDPKNRVRSMDLSSTAKKSDDMSMEWDDSEMSANPSAVQQAWMEKRQKSLVMRSYEEVMLPPEPGAASSPTVAEKLRHGWSPRDGTSSSTNTSNSENEKLPPGWSKVIGEDGVYYWHVKSGKTQWTLPTEAVSSDKLASDVDDEFKELNSTLDDFQMHTMKYAAAALASSNDSSDHDAPKTFKATALGWEEVDETELVRGKMVSVVLACIRRITVTKGDNLKNAIATGGQGKEVFLQIHGVEIRLLNPESSTVLSVQPINKIRVWGIGAENDRDFGYIARDPSTQRHKCHVFRCQVPAQAVARALVINHGKSKKSKLEDSNYELYEANPHDESNSKQLTKPSVSIDDDHEDDAITESSLAPILTENESYQRFECTYLGKVETKSAYGIDTIIDSLAKLSSEAEDYRWIDVHMDIASSHIKIVDKKTEDQLAEHRVRFLSFLGINPKDEKYCGYIVDNGDSQFMCHGFKADPNANKMCIALHGACQARFQRVLDSQPQQLNTSKEERRQTFSAFFKKKAAKKQPGPPPPPSKSNEPLYKYTVHLLGSMPVAQSASLENVKECVQQLTEKFKSPQVKHTTGDFEIMPTGINIIGHQKKLFGKEKHYSFKNVTYCVKLKNYFAFVYRESSSKCVCHVFAELEVDAATIVCAIQKTIMPIQAPGS